MIFQLGKGRGGNSQGSSQGHSHGAAGGDPAFVTGNQQDSSGQFAGEPSSASAAETVRRWREAAAAARTNAQTLIEGDAELEFRTMEASQGSQLSVEWPDPRAAITLNRPISGGPVSNGPASNGPVSGGPVSGGPVSGGPASAGGQISSGGLHTMNGPVPSGGPNAMNGSIGDYSTAQAGFAPSMSAPAVGHGSASPGSASLGSVGSGFVSNGASGGMMNGSAIPTNGVAYPSAGSAATGAAATTQPAAPAPATPARGTPAPAAPASVASGIGGSLSRTFPFFRSSSSQNSAASPNNAAAAASAAPTSQAVMSQNVVGNTVQDPSGIVASRSPAWKDQRPSDVLSTIKGRTQLPPEEDIKNRFGTNIKSALGPGTIIEGKFRFDSPVSIEGTLIGEVTSNSVLIVGTQANVTAKITVGSLIILGRVQGDVECEELLEIKSTGHLEGDVRSKRIAIDEGGWFRGLCTPKE